MRILAIRGKNLASLARSFAVELGSGPLEDVGLFAITGPVGAGKSTLLDAMCLALFDRTPRLSGRGGTPIGDDGQDRADWLRANDPRTLLRREALDGHAEVDFVGQDGRAYRARWSVRRAYRRADGRLQEQELSLTDLARGTVVASGRRTSVLHAIRRRLGLDFAQFCRSVLLAQGEFHAFLHAAADERAKLLETLTGAAIYRQLSKAAHERRRAGEQRVDLLRGQLDASAVLAATERRAFEDEAGRLAQQLAICDVGITLAQRYVTWHAAAAEHRQAESAATVALQAAQEAHAVAVPRRRLLEARQRALAAVPRWEVAEAARVDVREAEAAAARATQAGERAAAAHAAAARAIGALLAAAFGEVATLPAVVRELPQWEALLRRWQARERRAREVAAALPARTATVDQAAAALREARAAAAASDAERRAAAEVVEEAERSLRDDEAARLAGERAALDAARRRARAVADAATAWVAAAAGADAARARAEQLRAEHARRTAAATAANAAAGAAEGEARAAAAALERAEKHHGLAALRAQLVDGEPCPLCGAHEHPAAHAGGVADLAALRVAAAAAARAHAAAQRQQAEAAAEFLRVQRELQAAIPAAASADEAAAGLARAFVALVPQPRCDVPAAASQFAESEQRRIEAAEQTLAAAEAAFAVRSRALHAAVQAAAAADAVHRQRLERVDAAVLAERAALEAARALQQEGERLVGEIEDLHASLQPACDGLPGGVAALAQLGDERIERLTALHAAAVQQAKTAAAAAATAAESARADASLQRAREGLARAEQQLEQALAANGVAVDDVAIAARLGADALALEAAELRQLADEVARCRTVLQERARQRQQHERHDRPSLDVDEAASALADAHRARQEVDRQHVAVRAKLLADDDMRRRQQELRPRLERAEAELSVWRALDDLIGSSTGDAFAVFAQGLTLDLLLIEANRRLEELARRYRLEKSVGGELDFVVVDLDTGGARRSLWTLSGGETFLVSLALALALATLAAPRARVETLFLDEGFGTLDAHNLEIALGALDSLQATGCQVGVISHIDGFAERIGAVVEVRPEGAGQSRVLVAR